MNYHLIGIKGTGMAALAQILMDQGHTVQGSDIPNYIFTQDELEQKGVLISGFEDLISPDTEAVIVGLSFDEKHPQVIQARERNLPVYWYNEFLGHFLKDFTSICVAGCHGKSTTTGMMASVLEQNGPAGFLIGDGHGVLDDQASTFVLESCEHQRHFLAYHPDYAIITNIELDHIDYYKDLDDYISAYQSFVNQVSEAVVFNGDDPYLGNLDYSCKAYSFGTGESNRFRACSIVYDQQGTRYDVLDHGNLLGRIELKQTGLPYLYDSLACVAMGIVLGLPFEAIAAGLQKYQGIHRRFEEEIIDQSVLIDDYAHHPTAVSYMIDAVRKKYPNKKVVALYKPDRFSRLQFFLDDFARALNEADQSFVLDFPANARREDETITVTIDDLLDKLDHGALLDLDLESARKLAELEGSVFLFMSSKNIYLLRDQLKELLNNRKQLMSE